MKRASNDMTTTPTKKTRSPSRKSECTGLGIVGHLPIEIQLTIARFAQSFPPRYCLTHQKWGEFGPIEHKLLVNTVLAPGIAVRTKDGRFLCEESTLQMQTTRLLLTPPDPHGERELTHEDQLTLVGPVGMQPGKLFRARSFTAAECSLLDAEQQACKWEGTLYVPESPPVGFWSTPDGEVVTAVSLNEWLYGEHGFTNAGKYVAPVKIYDMPPISRVFVANRLPLVTLNISLIQNIVDGDNYGDRWTGTLTLIHEPKVNGSPLLPRGKDDEWMGVDAWRAGASDAELARMLTTREAEYEVEIARKRADDLAKTAERSGTGLVFAVDHHKWDAFDGVLFDGVAAVNRLLDAGVPVDELATCGHFKGCTALEVAIRLCYYDLIELLLRRGADPNRPVGILEISPLMGCARTNNVAMAKRLLTAGADVHLRCVFGDRNFGMETRQWSALEIARHHEHQEIIALLTAASNACGDGGGGGSGGGGSGGGAAIA